MDFWTSFWNIFWFFFWVYAVLAYVTILFSVIADLFRDKSLKGWLKAVWLIGLVFLPVLSALVYLIVRGDGMAARNEQRFVARRDTQSAYIRSVSGISLSDEITKARALLDAGTITDQEYTLIKQKALSA